MSGTDELRRLLDERGVEWKEHRHTLAGSMAIQRETLWGQPIDNTNGKPIPHVYHYRATEMGDGRLFLEAQLVTPEQAISATLGPGTCRNVHEPPRNTTFWPTPHFKCSECGEVHVSMQYVYFCPNCGRRIEEDDG